jgi:nucleotide-binding universal stress UspA family protein
LIGVKEHVPPGLTILPTLLGSEHRRNGEDPMSYKSILVNLDIDGPIVPVVKAAAELAGRFQARLIGFCAAAAPMPMAGPESAGLAAETWIQMRDDIQSRFKDVHDNFVKAIDGNVVSDWRETLDHPTRALAEASRAADLIVMGAIEGAATGDAYRRADPGSVALQAGRPLLVVARDTKQVLAKKVVVAWKDTREARRAVADAVPLLKWADRVTVVTVATEIDQRVRDSLADVVAFLGTHGVNAHPELIEAPDDFIGLFTFIDAGDVDLVVSGAYGHSRLREWVFGGVTRSLLDDNRICRFMAS